MEVCREFRENRKRWLRRYKELERRMTEAEQQQKWDRAERIGEALLDMEEHTGFTPCFSCAKRSCPAHFDGCVSWNPMDENLHPVEA